MRFLVFIVCLFFAFPVLADGFFQGLPDVPLMPGLNEIEARALSFDKPEGRILIGVAAIDDSLADSHVESFYGQSLPQFGWTQVSPFSYARGLEKLEISIAQEGAQKILEITISP